MKKSKIESCTTDQDHHTDVATDKAVDESRRTFMATSALIGAAGAVGLGLNPTAVHAKGQSLEKRAGASGFQPLEVNSPMARGKSRSRWNSSRRDQALQFSQLAVWQ